MLIGTRGWQYRQWVGLFYPDDIPEEWQLAYYSNEMDCVLVPEKNLLEASAHELLAWHEEVGEQFRFIFELSTLENWRHCRAKIETIRGNIGGVALRFGEPVSPSLIECIQTLAQIAPVCVEESLARQKEIVNLATQVRNLGILVHVDSDGLQQIDTDAQSSAEETGSILFLIQQDKAITIKQLRMIMEGCLRRAGQAGTAALLFNGTVPDIDMARQAVQLQQLLL